MRRSLVLLLAVLGGGGRVRGGGVPGRLRCRRVELAGRRDARVVRRVLWRPRVGAPARMDAQRGRGVMMVLRGRVRRHAQTKGEASVGRGCRWIVVLTGGARLMVVAPVEATRSLLEIRVHYPGYFGSLALKHRHSREKTTGEGGGNHHTSDSDSRPIDRLT